MVLLLIGRRVSISSCSSELGIVLTLVCASGGPRQYLAQTLAHHPLPSFSRAVESERIGRQGAGLLEREPRAARRRRRHHLFDVKPGSARARTASSCAIE